MKNKFLFLSFIFIEALLNPLKSQVQSDSINVMNQNSKDTLQAIQTAPPLPVEGKKKLPPPSTQEKNEQLPPSPIQSAYANVKLNTPIISVDLIMDLYDKDIDFDIEYTGTSSKAISSGTKAKPSESDVAKVVTSSSASPFGAGSDTSKSKQGDKENPISPYTAQDANYNKALVYLNNAQKLFSGQKYANALREINRSIQFAPNIAMAYAVRGSILYMLKQPDDAKQSWERALELDPSLDNVRALLLRMY